MRKLLLILFLAADLGQACPGPELSGAVSCGRGWAGNPALPHSRDLPRRVFDWSVSSDETFMTYVMAVITVESAWRPKAKSSAGARGLMQVTPIARDEAIKHCQFDTYPSNARLYDPETNVRVGTCYLQHAAKSTVNWTEALAMYNGGWRQVMRLRQGKNLAAETANYIIKVTKLVEECRGF